MTDMNKQTEALKLAEDALKRVRTQDMELVQLSMIALAAIREAQAEQPAPVAKPRKQEPVACERCLELERLCDATYVAQGADAYNHACDEMERWQQTRQKAGKEVGTTGSLCDGISWLYGHIDELEAKVATPQAQPAREPLTDEQWQSIADTLGCIITRGQKDAIEAAHGIKGDA